MLFDDAMISMRYARNFAHGFGLVWNPGEAPVEGYTNTLWTLFMSIFHVFPMAEPLRCLPIQIVGVLIQIATIVCVRNISLKIHKSAGLIVWLPIILTAFYLPLNSWSLQGMEVGALAFLLVAVAARVQDVLAIGAAAPSIYVLLALANLVRMDALIVSLLTIGFLMCYDASRRKTHLIFGWLSIFISQGLLELFRVSYYHDFLPNTYYLKVSGYPLIPRIAQGAYNLGKFLLKSNPWFFAIAAFALFKEKEKRFLFYLAVITIGQYAYSVYVGGDAWEGWGNRYIVEAMPLFFILFSVGIRCLSELKVSGKLAAPLPRVVAFLLALLAPLSFNNVPGLKNLFLLDHPIAYDFNSARLNLGVALNKVLLPKAKIATTLSGILPYFVDRNDVDMLGKCDPVIAKEEMHRLEDIVPAEISWRWFYPGHMKWDYKHSIGELQPDVVVELWARQEDALPYLAGKYRKITVDGFPVYLKKDSPNIDWKSPLIKE